MSIGKTYKSMLEYMIKDAGSLYSEDEYDRLKQTSEKIDPVLEIQAWTMEVASTEQVPQYNVMPKSYTSFVYSSLVRNALAVPSKSSVQCNTELVDCLDIIMKEIMNAFKGIKEPMHIIMEEEELYEQSFIGGPVRYNEHEESLIREMNESAVDMLSRSDMLNNSNLGVQISSDTITMESPVNGDDGTSPQQLTFKEPDEKDGHLLFNVLRGEIVKAFSLKSNSKADSYLDKITFIARKMINIWFGKPITVENFNMFVDLLKEKAYLISFPAMLESFRKMNCFELDPNGYQPFCELILASLTEVQ